MTWEWHRQQWPGGFIFSFLPTIVFVQTMGGYRSIYIGWLAWSGGFNWWKKGTDPHG